MPIESKEVNSYLGFDEKEVDSIDKFKEKFDGEFVRKAALKDYNSAEHKEFFPIAIGRVAGTLEKDVTKYAKEAGAEITPEEIKGKRIQEVVDIAWHKAEDVWKNKIADLEKNAGAGKDELVKELEGKYQKLEKKFGDLNTLHAGLQSTYNEEKTGWQSQVKTIKLDNILSKKHEGIKWNTAAKPLEKEGFFAHLKNNYKVDLDETGNLDLFDKSGARIPNPAKAGTWKSYDDILAEEGTKLGIWEASPHKGNLPRPVIQTPNSQQQNTIAQPVRKMSAKVQQG